ncbi:MAG: hypothetical protein RLZZ360_413 [Candidatus Parcubacteria bacterium]
MDNLCHYVHKLYSFARPGIADSSLWKKLLISRFFRILVAEHIKVKATLLWPKLLMLRDQDSNLEPTPYTYPLIP